MAFGRFLARALRAAPGLMLPLLACLAPAGAQQESAEPGQAQDAQTRYTVELIVFTYNDTASVGNEIFLPDRPREPFDPFAQASPAEMSADLPGELEADAAEFGDRDSADTARLADAGDDGREAPLSVSEIPAHARIEMRLLDPSRYSMTDIYRKLQELDAYRPVMHTAWTQTTQEPALTPALRLRALGRPPLGLDGSIALYQSRFLHLDVDLSLDAARYRETQTATDRLVISSDGRLQSDEEPEVDRLQPPVRYRIVEDRIMRNGEIRYFDHPLFGLIAKVSRVEVDGEGGEQPPRAAGGD